MTLKFFKDYPYEVYSILTWGLVIIFFGIKELKRLWPISIISALTIFIAALWLAATGVYKFDAYFLPLSGIPFFFIFWGAANGIVFAHFFGKKIYQRFLSIIIFAGITVGLESIVEFYKKVQHVGKFNDFHEFVYDVIILTALSFIMTSLFESRLLKKSER